MKIINRGGQELKNCNEQFNAVQVENDDLSVTNAELTQKNVIQKKKTKRNRRIAIGEGIALAGIITLLFTIK